MSVEERLYALAQQCRQQNGDAFLSASSQLVPRLNGQAPDLHGEIRALAAAFELGAAARIAAAGDADGEAAKIASEIAVRERMSIAAVSPAIAVARRLGPLRTSAPAPAAPQGGWAGDSVVVGAAPTAQAAQAAAYPAQRQAPSWQTPGVAPQPQGQMAKLTAFAKKNPLIIAAIAVVGGYFAYQQNQAQQQQQPAIGGQQQPLFPGQQPQQPQQPMQPGQQPQQPMMPGQQPQQPQQTSMPMLQPMGAGGPMLAVQRHPQTGAPVFTFSITTPRGPAPGMVMMPAGGWQSGPVGFMLGMPGDPTGQSVGAGGQGMFQLGQSSNGAPTRMASIQMSQDNLGTGGVCLMFRGQQGQQDVQLSGAEFCLMNNSCAQPIGCGRLQ